MCRQACRAESDSQRQQSSVRPWNTTVVSDPEAGCFSIKEMGPSASSWPWHQGAFLWGQPCRYSYNVVLWLDTGEKFLFSVQTQ